MKKYMQNGDIVLRKVGDVFLLIPVHGNPKIGLASFLVLNYTGSVIWKCISRPESEDEIYKELMQCFDLTDDGKEEIQLDISMTLKRFFKVGFCIEV